MSGVEFLLGAAALQAISTLVGAESAAAMDEAEAEIAQQQAQRERALAEREADDFRRDQRRRLAALRARRAGSGVTLQGSPLLVESAAAGDIELGARRRLNAGRARAVDLRRRSALGRQTAINRRRDGYLDAGTSLLTDLSRIDFGD